MRPASELAELVAGDEPLTLASAHAILDTLCPEMDERGLTQVYACGTRALGRWLPEHYGGEHAHPVRDWKSPEAKAQDVLRAEFGAIARSWLRRVAAGYTAPGGSRVRWDCTLDARTGGAAITLQIQPTDEETDTVDLRAHDADHRRMLYDDHQIARLVVTYNGNEDNGSIVDVTGVSRSGAEFTIEDIYKSPLYTAVDAVFATVLTLDGLGFNFNNEGSSGEVDVDVKAWTATRRHVDGIYGNNYRLRLGEYPAGDRDIDDVEIDPARFPELVPLAGTVA